MTIGTILVHLNHEERARELIAAAAVLARKGHAHVVGLYVMPPLFIAAATTRCEASTSSCSNAPPSAKNGTARIAGGVETDMPVTSAPRRLSPAVWALSRWCCNRGDQA